MGSFWSGLLGGSIIGAIFGLLVTVLFEDYLVSQRERLVRRLTMRTRRKRRKAIGSVESTDLFELGPLKTSMLILEGDGDQVINEQSIILQVDPVEVELPAEMAEWRQEFLAQQEDKKANAENSFWNGLNYAVSDFNVSRTAIDEHPEIQIRLRYSDYATFRAVQQLDRTFDDGSSPRKRYLEPFQAFPLKVPDFMSSSFGTNVALMTADGMFIFARRSGVVGSRPGVWSTSANEGLSRSLDSRGRAAPNLYDVMRRGINEELGITAGEYELEMLAVHLDRELHQWGGTWFGILKELTGDDVLARRARGVADKYENHELCLVRANPTSTLEFILKQGAADAIAPHTAVVYYLSLVRFHGRRRVEQALKRLTRAYKA